MQEMRRMITRPQHYSLQTGQFKHGLNAAYQMERLQLLGYQTNLLCDDSCYTVLVGNFATPDEAEETRSQLQDQSYFAVIVAR